MLYMPNTTDKFLDEYPSPSAARSTFTVVVECICCMACVMNILLFLVFSYRPLKTRSYNYFFILSIIQNLVSAISFFLIAPQAITFNSVFLLISTGRGGEWMIGPFVMLLYSMTFVSSMIFVTNNFIHKYFQLCRPLSLNIYASPKWLLLITLINFAVVVNWIAMNVYSGWPSKEFVRSIRDIVIEHQQFDISDATFMGVSMTYDLTTSRFILLVEALVLVLAVGCVGLSFAMYIHIHLAHVKMMSTQTRRSHQQLLMVLLLQTACPIVLLHIPLYTMYGLLFTGATSPHWLGITIGILMALFPLTSPLISLTFIKDYRKFILTLFTMNCKNVGMSSSSPTTRTIRVKSIHTQK
ncbi:hypothetical protein V3C99_013185 [Haemonchus contortus]